MGLDDDRERHRDRAREPAARRHRRRRRPAQALAVRLHVGHRDRLLPVVVRPADARGRADGAGDRGADQRRLRDRRRVLQRDAARDREPRLHRAPVRLGLGLGLCRRSGLPADHAVRLRPGRAPPVRPRPAAGGGCPHRRAAGRPLARAVQPAAVPVHARSAEPSSAGRRGGAARPRAAPATPSPRSAATGRSSAS